MNSVRFDWAGQIQYAVLGSQCLWQISEEGMRLISPFGLTAALLWMLNKTNLMDQCCFILVIYYSEIE